MADLASPLISPASASACSLLLTGAYVGSLYLSKASRISRASTSASNSPASLTAAAAAAEAAERQRLGRDHPAVIRARLQAVGGATVACCCGVWGIVQLGMDEARGLQSLSLPSLESLSRTWTLLGFPHTLNPFPPGAWAFLTSHSLTQITQRLLDPASSPLVPFLLAPLLFLGPLYSEVYLERLGLTDAWETLATWTGLRNYVVAPATEEIVFRSCIIALAQLCGASWRHQVFISPLWFGLAHAHHALEVFNTRGRTKQAAVFALATSAFQFTYTTLFGWFAAYLFVKTGSVLPPLFAHIFCNSMGLPQPASACARHPYKKLETGIAYAVGVVGFVLGLKYC